MRSLASGNKKIFTGFTLVIILIIVLLITTLIIVTGTEKEIYEVREGAYLYDEKYELIKLESDGTIIKEWNGKYYLTQDGSKTKKAIGNKVVVYDGGKNKISIYGDSYQVFKDAQVDKIVGKNEINNLSEDKFYKLEDRKYLLIGETIKNDKGNISTKRYLVIELDKSGNTLLLNHEIDTRTINPMILETNSYKFDIANEKLIFGEEEIDLKKIIGSTNEYKEKENIQNEVANNVENNIENTEQNQHSGSQIAEDPQGGVVSPGSENYGTGANNGGIWQNNGNSNSNNNNPNYDLNGSQGNNNNQNIVDPNQNYNNNQNIVGDNQNNDHNQNIIDDNQNDDNKDIEDNTNKTPLVKNISLRSTTAGSSYIDIEYSVVDPENLYRMVYIELASGNDKKVIALDKSNTKYRISDLTPNTTYRLTLGYNEILSDNSTQDVKEDIMIVKTSKVKESLNITKFSRKQITFNLKLDSNYTYDSAKIVLYIDDQKIQELDVDINKASSTSGWTANLSYGQGTEYKICLEKAVYNGKEIKSTLQAKIVME